MEEYTIQEINEIIEEKGEFYLYLYTPFCGTCQLAEKIVTVVTRLLPSLHWGKSNLNYLPEQARSWEIESVPCLVFFRDKKIIKKIYAFHSVPYLYETVQSIAAKKKE